MIVLLLGSCSSKAPVRFNDDGALLSPDRFLNIAHRGASGHAPEHTIPAYEKGNQMNSDYIEIDLQLTKDNQLVAMHDDDVDRTSNKSGKVQSFTLAELKKLNVGSWFNKNFPTRAKSEYNNLQVPTLAEIFDQFGNDSNYYIEIKGTKHGDLMIDKLLQTLDKYNLITPDGRDGQVIIQSFHQEFLQKIHELEPSIPLVQLIRYQKKAKINERQLATIRDYAIGIGLNHKHLSEKYVKKVRKSGLLLHPYTVNDKEKMKQFIKWGVTGIFTDYPDRLDEVLEEMKAGG